MTRHAASGRGVDGMSYQLLVMDDSVTIRRVVELTFAGGDVRVVGVGDGRAALERIDADPPDVILADVGTSQPDGYEVSAYVKGNPALAHIPVLLLSGAFQPIDERRTLSSGCDGVLAKPFDPVAMTALVRQAIEARRDDAEPVRSAPDAPDAPEAPDAPAAAPSAGDAAGPLPPSAGLDGDLLAFFERLLAEPVPEGGEDARMAVEVERASPPEPLETEGIPSSVSDADPFCLDDYFDLVDELLARARVTDPSPAPDAPPHPPRSSSTACNGCPRESTAS